MTRFLYFSALTMLQHLFTSYRVIETIDIKDDVVKMMGNYDPVEPLA